MGLRYTDMFEFPVKTFFWALSTDFEFKEFPSLTVQHDAAIDADQTYFVGDPARMIVSVKGGNSGGDQEAEEEKQPDEEEDDGQAKKIADSDESEEEEIKVPQRDLTGKLK